MFFSNFEQKKLIYLFGSIASIVFLATCFNFVPIVVAASLACERSSPQNVPVASMWGYPKGLSKPDMTPGQGLTLNSVVNPGIPHNGEDYGNHPAGFEIYAVADGWVACTYSSTDAGDLGNAVFVESILPDGKHVTTLYGHLSKQDLISTNSFVKQGQTRIGKLGTSAENGNWPVHLHVGIRDGFYIGLENGWPTQCWGYLRKRDATRSGCPENPTEEFKHWYALSAWAESLPAIQVWRTQPEKSTDSLTWWWTFGTCETDRRIQVYLDDNTTPIFYTSSEDGVNPSTSATVWSWFKDHKVTVKVFDYPNTPTVEVSWAFAPLGPLQPVRPACGSEITPTPTDESIASRSTPSATAPLAFLVTATPTPQVVPRVIPTLTRTPIPTSTKSAFGPEAVWIPGDYFYKFQNCSVPLLNCVVSVMRASGASAEAIRFTTILKGEGYMDDFKEYGIVDLAEIVYPSRANRNSQNALLNGNPQLILVEDVGTNLRQDPNYPALSRKYPGLGTGPDYIFKAMQKLPQGGQRFIFEYDLIDFDKSGFSPVGSATVAFDFDGRG